MTTAGDAVQKIFMNKRVNVNSRECREIIFQVFQCMWSRYIRMLQTDRRTDITIFQWHNRALRRIARLEHWYRWHCDCEEKRRQAIDAEVTDVRPHRTPVALTGAARRDDNDCGGAEMTKDHTHMTVDDKEKRESAAHAITHHTARMHSPRIIRVVPTSSCSLLELLQCCWSLIYTVHTVWHAH